MVTKIPTDNADIATAASATVVLGNLARQIGMPKMGDSSICASISPVYGIVWNRRGIDAIATDRANEVLDRIRNSALRKQEYRRLTAMFLEAYHSANSFPSELREWRQKVARFRLDSTFGRGQIVEMRTFFHKKGICAHLIRGVFIRRSLMFYSEDAPLPS